jgi:hypothetical protein
MLQWRMHVAVVDSICSGGCLECQVSVNVVADSCCSGGCIECQASVTVVLLVGFSMLQWRMH